MIFRRLGLINKKQAGFTILELLIAFAITALVTGGITATIQQVLTGSTRTSNHMVAVKQAQNAGYWVSRDAQMAQSTNTSGANGFPLTLAWTDWDTNEGHQVVYSLIDMGSGIKRLERQQLTYDINGVEIENVTNNVARYIDPGLTQVSCNATSGVLTFTVTASVGSGTQEQSETRVYEILPKTIR